MKGGDHPPPEFSKNKIEKSILEHVFSEGGLSIYFSQSSVLFESMNYDSMILTSYSCS